MRRTSRWPKAGSGRASALPAQDPGEDVDDARHNPLSGSRRPSGASASATRRTWNKPYWQKAFGISAKDVEAAIEIIPKALDGRCLTREALADEVHRITRNQALDELMRAGWGSVLKIVAAEERLCFGPQ